MRRSGFNCSKSQVRGKIIFRKRKKERKETEWTHSAWANNSAYRDVSPVFIFCLEVVFFCFFLPAVPRARSIEIITDTYINLRRIYMQTVFFLFFSCPVMYIYFFSGWFLFALLSLDLFVVGLPTGRRREVMCDANASVRHFFSGPHSPKRKKKIT